MLEVLKSWRLGEPGGHAACGSGEGEDMDVDDGFLEDCVVEGVVEMESGVTGASSSKSRNIRSHSRKFSAHW